MRAAVDASAYRVVDDPDRADVVVVNTCSFIKEATEESIEVVLELASTWAPLREGRRLIVAGCMPSRYGDDLTPALPEIDAFLPVASESTLLDVLEQLTGVPSQKKADAPGRSLVGPSAYLQVSDGCHRRCAYCTIPSIRGPYRSRPLPELVREASELVAAGAREIVLIGQDVTAYGRDLDESLTLADVVDAIAETPGVRWLRLMYAQPEGITPQLLSAMAAHENVCRYLDMPLQHASKSVLKRMRRRGDAETYLKLIRQIRSVLPDVVLRTTLIAGFPGETPDDVRELKGFLRTAAFDYVGVFVYSPEDGTEAADMPAQVPLRTRRARAQRLRDLADEIGTRRAEALVGKTVEVLIEGEDPEDGQIMGRWRGQAPEIDGFVLLDAGKPGEIVSARIVDSLGYDLEGEVVR